MRFPDTWTRGNMDSFTCWSPDTAHRVVYYTCMCIYIPTTLPDRMHTQHALEALRVLLWKSPTKLKSLWLVISAREPWVMQPSRTSFLNMHLKHFTNEVRTYTCTYVTLNWNTIAEQSWVLVSWELHVCKTACGNNLRSPIYGGYIGSKEALVQNDHGQKLSLSLLLLSWIHS